MKPGQIIELPKPDKRYRVGHIAKDKSGRYRGHPLTVIPVRQNSYYLESLDYISQQLSPPIVISRELAELLGEEKTNG